MCGILVSHRLYSNPIVSNYYNQTIGYYHYVIIYYDNHNSCDHLSHLSSQLHCSIFVHDRALSRNFLHNHILAPIWVHTTSYIPYYSLYNICFTIHYYTEGKPVTEKTLQWNSWTWRHLTSLALFHKFTTGNNIKIATSVCILIKVFICWVQVY